MIFFFVALLGLSLSSLCGANVIGIDFGSDNIKVGMISPGKFDIVTNFQSKRRTPNNIAFYQGERLYGSDAYALMARKPEIVFSKFFRMIGKTSSNPRVTELQKQYFPYQIYSNETSLMTSIKYEDSSFTPEELLAMMMTHIKDMTKEYGGSAVKDCVITVPSSFTQHERNALHTAAQIADLNILSLIEENTAAALHFAIDRVFDEPHNVLFYNLGSGQIQVTIATFGSYPSKDGSKNKTTGQFQVVGKAWDEEIGGFNFDLALANLLATRFNSNWQKKKSGAGKDIRDFVRPMTRLRMDALKVREVLSANNEYPYKVEQLHADVDLSTKVSRIEFEDAVNDLLKKITAPIDRALAMANMTLKDIHAVELLGGGVRMPRVKNVLDSYFKVGDLELGQHLNGDEAMALGATFRGANISTAFRVRKVGMTDITPLGVSVKFDNLPVDNSGVGLLSWLLGQSKPVETTETHEWSKQTPLFPVGSSVPSKTKIVAFHHDQDILCRLEYDSTELFPGTSSLFAVLNVTGIAEFAKETSSYAAGQPKIHLSFTLDGSGLVALSKAEATLDLPVVEEVVEGEEVADENSTDPVNTASDKSEAESASEKNEKEKKTAKKTPKKYPKKEKKDNILRKTLTVVLNTEAVSPPIWSTQSINDARNRLKAFDLVDAQRKEKAAALNDLEGYVYKIRNRIRDEEEQLSIVSTSEQREEVIDLCNAVEEWLYDEGRDQEVAVYKGKQSSIRVKADAIFKRDKEHTARPEAVKKASHQLSAVRQLVGEWEETMPQITQEEKDKLLETVQRIEVWLQDNVDQQSKLSPYEAPAFISSEVSTQLKPLTSQLEKLLKKPKPIPVKTSNETSTNTTNSTTGEAPSDKPETVHINPETEEPPLETATDEL